MSPGETTAASFTPFADDAILVQFRVESRDVQTVREPALSTVAAGVYTQDPSNFNVDCPTAAFVPFAVSTFVVVVDPEIVVNPGPVGPVGPVDPTPVGPVGPVGPVAPAPVGPVGPVGPVAPAPVGPVGPVGPVAPAPVGPVGPVLPVVPVGPVEPAELTPHTTFVSVSPFELNTPWAYNGVILADTDAMSAPFL